MKIKKIKKLNNKKGNCKISTINQLLNKNSVNSLILNFLTIIILLII